MAAPLTPREEAMSQTLRTDFTQAASEPVPSNGIKAEFNRAAAGQQPGGAADGKTERPQANHNIEPAIQDKKAGAILDKAPSRERYDRIRDSLAARDRGRDLGLEFSR